FLFWFYIIDISLLSFCFFFQAEDGIRDRNVTGVQTCALPIWAFAAAHRREPAVRPGCSERPVLVSDAAFCPTHLQHQQSRSLRRSEERRVGKECRSRWGA